MANGKPALVLFHPFGMSGNSAWQEVIPLLAKQYRVYAPTALGHRLGPPVGRNPVTMADVVDAAESYLDESGLDRPHLAGNSMGGYMAIELARRGRAETVCAISPPGFWSSGDGLQAQAFRGHKKNRAIGRLTRPVAPLMVKSATLRRLGLRDVARRGDRLTADQFLAMTDDSLACQIVTDLAKDQWYIAPLDPLPCPVAIAWCEHDETLPAGEYARNVAERIPRATFETIPDVGHVPMIDDPALVARIIQATIGATRQ
jgi:pimeloyl-ACP methyl ester carboxylesterase